MDFSVCIGWEQTTYNLVYIGLEAVYNIVSSPENPLVTASGRPSTPWPLTRLWPRYYRLFDEVITLFKEL